MKNKHRLHLGVILVVAGLLMLGVGVADASAKAARIEARSVVVPKELNSVELKKINKRGVPKRLRVGFNDGSLWRFTPCKYEDSRNCFWWAPARGNKRGWSFINLKGTVYYL